MSAGFDGPFRYRPMVRKEGHTLVVTEPPPLYSPDLRIDFRVSPRAPENEILLPNSTGERYFLRWWHHEQDRQRIEYTKEEAYRLITMQWKTISHEIDCRDLSVFNALLARMSERIVTIIRAAIVAKQQRTMRLIRHERNDVICKPRPTDVFYTTQLEYFRAQRRVIDEYTSRQQPDSEDSLPMVLEEPPDLRNHLAQMKQQQQQQAVTMRRDGMPGMPPEMVSMDHQADFGQRPFLDRQDIEFVIQDCLARSENYVRGYVALYPPSGDQDAARRMQQKDQKPAGQ